MPSRPTAPRGYKVISRDVSRALAEILSETGRLKGDLDRLDRSLVPGGWVPMGWQERSGATWAGLLKLVEERLRTQRSEYKALHVTATDGHRTLRVPLSVTIHLLTEKIRSSHSAGEQ
jgi:hypothetical protein